MVQKYKHIDVLGRGGNGIVWKVSNKKNEYFAKKILKNTSDVKAYSRFKDEVEIITKHKHKGIIEIIDFHLPEKYYSKNNAYYVMPIGIPLKEYIKTIGLDELFEIILKIIDTIEFLHNNNITHRDLKIENILMIGNEPKISDFGLANFPKQKRVSRLNEKIGPAFTIAPEMKRISSISEYKKADVYSLAKTLWVILTKQWLSFDGQYNNYSSISLKNHLELMINQMTLIGATYYNSIVILEKLLSTSTHNDPEKRQTISEFKEQFLFWLESNKDYQLRNNIEWIDALEKVFPLAIPESCNWSNIKDIQKVLNIFFSNYDQLNHCFYPISGGSDFHSVRILRIDGIDYLLINEDDLMRTKNLTFEFMNDYKWSYFRLEIKSSNPLFGKSVYENEEYVYLDENDNVLPDKSESTRAVSFFLNGSFLIVQKVSKINKLNGELDHYSGIHNKMTNIEYKKLVEKIKNYR